MPPISGSASARSGNTVVSLTGAGRLSSLNPSAATPIPLSDKGQVRQADQTVSVNGSAA